MNGETPIVIALGGNAISADGGPGDLADQFTRTRCTAKTLARLLSSGVPVVITHGNGPQVGQVLRRVELAAHEVYSLPLDICVADTQGGMGYMIAQCLRNELRSIGVTRGVAAVVTSVEVARDDPDLANPTKPIGRHYPDELARDYQLRCGWKMVQFPKGWRRVAPSPRPLAIVEIELIRRLAWEGEIVIAGGGGGVAVFRDATGALLGVEAVVDKDRTSAVLAVGVGARTLVIATAARCAQRGFGTPTATDLRRLAAAEAQELLAQGEFPPGTMGPKVEAAITFLRAAGPDSRAIICHLDEIEAALASEAGTCITL